MRPFEDEYIEYKEAYVDDIKKSIIAFANSTGGTIYIGVSDSGEVVGVQDPDDVSLRVSNMIRDTIHPDITLCVQNEIRELEGKYIVVITVQQGTNRPYYLAKKGLRPEGVFVRHGASSVSASSDAIRELIKVTDGLNYESLISPIQDLTFESAQAEFKKQHVLFGPAQMKSLGLIDSQSLYTNVALIISDQCPHTVKFATFQENDKFIFKSRDELSGSIFKQMNDLYQHIQTYNHLQSRIEGLYRKETYNYPLVAIRESLLNFLVHRDYSYRWSSSINIYPDSIEFISYGGLVPGVTKQDIMNGVSACRNEKLAHIFYRLELIEQFGTGISKIFASYAGADEQPSIVINPHSFVITLPNTHPDTDFYAPKGDKNKTGFDQREKMVVEYVQIHGKATKHEVVELLDTSPATASRILKQMTDKRLLARKGRARATNYVLAVK